MSLSYEIKKISSHPSWIEKSACWFASKWSVSYETYVESMQYSLTNTVPEWYIVESNGTIMGGCGIIENDFHPRKDLTPNLCALYVEEKYRNQKLAKNLLTYVCKDMKEKGVKALYLLTNHTNLYERYGWKFLCMVQGDGEENFSQMYMYELQ